MHSVTVILKTRRTKAALHIKGINKVYIQCAFKVDFLLCLSSYVGSENGKFSSPKVLAARPNLWEWWVGEKTNRRDNDVGDDSIVDGSSTITKTMRIRACLIGRQIWIPFDHGVPAKQENSLDRENPGAVMNENLW
jgi:hypothetical protein